MTKLLLLFPVFLCMEKLKAQNDKQVLFHSGDRICFVGNSITNNGEFHNMISLFYATRYPLEQLDFFNCGISGNTAGDGLKRLDSDILIHHPTWSAVMFGMNDVKRDLYNPARKNDPGIIESRSKALQIYRQNMEQIIQRLLNSNSRVIIQKPSIYDQTGSLKSLNMFGVNDALEICSRYIDTLAAKYNLPVVDYQTILQDINRQMQREDSTATIIGSDRVHPQSPGHFVMAYQFLRSTVKPSVVSEMDVNAGNLKTRCENCSLTNIEKSKGRIYFLCNEKSLPFPIDEESEPALRFISFIRDYDQEILRISKLKKGNYRLLIDGKEMGKFTNTAFKKGINLALINETPQYLQSSGILSLFKQRRSTEGKIRDIRFVEYNFLPPGNSSNRDSVEAYLNHLLAEKYSKSEYRDYYEAQFKRYLQFKSQEEAIQTSLSGITEKIYQLNKPVSHSFELVRE